MDIFNPFADIVKIIAFYSDSKSVIRLPIVCSGFYLSLEDPIFWKKMMEKITRPHTYRPHTYGPVYHDWKKAYTLCVTLGLNSLLFNSDVNLVSIALSTQGFITEKDQAKVFFKACDSENVELIMLMLREAQIYSAFDEALNDSSAKGRNTIVKLLLNDRRMDMKGYESSAITDASINGRVSTVKLLLAHPTANPEYRCNIAIRKSAAFGRAEIVKLLLEDKRVNPTDYKNCAIELAYKNRNINECILVIELLLNDTRVISKLNNKQIEKYKACFC